MASARELFATSEGFFCQQLLFAPSANEGSSPKLKLA
jgi:hypothetical protein